LATFHPPTSFFLPNSAAKVCVRNHLESTLRKLYDDNEGYLVLHLCGCGLPVSNDKKQQGHLQHEENSSHASYHYVLFLLEMARNSY